MGNCERRRRESAIAEGKKPLTSRGYRERRKLPQKPTQFLEFDAEWSSFLALIYLKFFTDDFDIKVPIKPSRSVKKYDFIIFEETEILDVRRTPLAVAALKIEMSS